MNTPRIVSNVNCSELGRGAAAQSGRRPLRLLAHLGLREEDERRAEHLRVAVAALSAAHGVLSRGQLSRGELAQLQSEELKMPE